MSQAPIVLAACLLLQACAAPPPPPPPPDMPTDATASAPAIGTAAAKSAGWLARLLMRLAGNTTLHIDVQATTTPGAKP